MRFKRSSVSNSSLGLKEGTELARFASRLLCRVFTLNLETSLVSLEPQEPLFFSGPETN